MTSIKLTETHKSKLLEMCKILFPEYINIEFDEDKLYFLTQECFDINKKFGTQFSNEDYDFEIEDVYLEEYDVYIHWFEFCMTHLADKMLQLGELPNYDNKLDYEFNSILQSSWWESHPVDYLYEEFKKLKK